MQLNLDIAPDIVLRPGVYWAYAYSINNSLPSLIAWKKLTRRQAIRAMLDWIEDQDTRRQKSAIDLYRVAVGHSGGVTVQKIGVRFSSLPQLEWLYEYDGGVAEEACVRELERRAALRTEVAGA